MSMAKEQEKLRAALGFHQQGNVHQAARLYREIIRNDPHNAPALHYLGVIEAGGGNFAQAKSLMARSVSAQPQNSQFLENFATVCWQAGDHAAALQACERGLQGNPANVALLYLSAIALFKMSRLQESQAQFDKLLAIQPGHVIALNERASVLAETKRYDAALASVEKALALQPQYAEAHLNKANLYSLLERYDDALAEYDKTLALKPNIPDAWLGRGNVLRERKDYQGAHASYDKALALKPDLEGAWIGRGRMLVELRRYADALVAYEKAFTLKPSAGASLGCGNALSKLRRYDEAFAAYNRALALTPDYPEAWLSVGNTLAEQRRYDEALAAYGKALDSKPDWPEAWFSRGKVFADIKRYDEAFAAYDKAFVLKPRLPLVEGERLHVKTHLCDWKDFAAECAHLVSSAENNVLTAPATLLAILSSAEQQRKCAEFYNSELFPPAQPNSQPAPYGHDRIRVAYLSADFRDHPVAHLVAGLIEHHDRTRFEVIGISFGPDAPGGMRDRFTQSFDQFIEVNDRSDAEVAALLRSLEADIAVDLMAYTGGSRTGIFAHRPCAIQVNFLGYPGTMGAPYIDYLIADPTLIPDPDRPRYTEKIVTLPNTYQPNDLRRAIAETTPTRAQAGLPEAEFVFCCFNNNYKITPDVFDCWMRILRRVEGSVLWLYRSNPYAPGNLKKEAQARNVSADRLIFAEPVKLPEHLARHRLADLCLDTLPYNAHTTASDALWAGLPLLTQIGETFAARVAASLLKAVGLPELITSTREQYEEFAVELAAQPQRLAAIRQKLSENRLTAPLFDTRLFAAHIEAAYTAMNERYKTGLPPDHLSVRD